MFQISSSQHTNMNPQKRLRIYVEYESSIDICYKLSWIKKHDTYLQIDSPTVIDILHEKIFLYNTYKNWMKKLHEKIFDIKVISQ